MKQHIQNYLSEQGMNDICVDDILSKAQILSIIFQKADISQVPNEKVIVNQSITLPDECTQKRLYAVCDSVFEQISGYFLSLFLKIDEKIVRLSHTGRPALFDEMAVNNDTAQAHLAARVALSAWFNQVENSDEWVKSQELSPDFYPENVGVWALPICSDTGGVIGVLYGEHAHHDTHSSEHWQWTIALAVTTAEILQHIQQDIQAA